MDGKQKTAYDDILSYSNLHKFADYRRVLVGNRGSMASGRMPTAMRIVYGRNRMSGVFPIALDGTQEMDEENHGSVEEREPTDLVLDYSGSRRTPGLVFRKDCFDDILRQILVQQDIRSQTLLEALCFSSSTDRNTWELMPDKMKCRLLAKNLDKLNKETNANYRIYGDRLHYFIVGKVRTVDSSNVESFYPLMLFSCAKVDAQKMTISVDSTGFLNFWLDKNLLEDFFAKKNNSNFEISLDNDFRMRLNSIAMEINKMHFMNLKEVEVDPSFIGVQIVTGLEAEYIDPVWSKILEGIDYNE